MTQINSKSDRDRIRQRAGSRKIFASKVRSLLAMYHKGMSAEAFVLEVEKAMKGVK